MAELENKQNTISKENVYGNKETWLDRLTEEYQALGGRLERLEDFMWTDAAYEKLDREDRDLLLLQHEYMRRYAEILDLRLVRAATHRSGEER